MIQLFFASDNNVFAEGFFPEVSKITSSIYMCSATVVEHMFGVKYRLSCSLVHYLLKDGIVSYSFKMFILNFKVVNCFSEPNFFYNFQYN